MSQPYPSDIVALFWSRVEITSSCWLWKGPVSRTGYGKFNFWGTGILVHRFSYEIAVGQIQEGLEIDHLCKVRNCVNPQHLEMVTRLENIERSDCIPMENARKTHCKKGHELIGENLWIESKTGWRHCRTCSREAGRRADAKRWARYKQSKEKLGDN